MFGIGYICAMNVAVLMAKAEADEEIRFQDFLKTIPECDRASIAESRDKRKLAAKEYAIAERRHRELCDSIRSTSFWRF